MKWGYMIEEISGTRAATGKKLSELGSAGWEAVTSWSVPGGPQGAWRTYILFKKTKVAHDARLLGAPLSGFESGAGG
jgi:hypothetical protein